MPLPVSAIGDPLPAARVPELDQPRRVRDCPARRRGCRRSHPSSARARSRPCTSRPTSFAISCACFASSAGGQIEGGRVDEIAGPRSATRRRPGLARSLPSPPSRRPAPSRGSVTLRTALGVAILLRLVAVEPVGAEDQRPRRSPGPRRPCPSTRPAGGSSRPSRASTAARRRGRSRAARRRDPPSACSPTPTNSTSPRRQPVVAGVRDEERLAALALEPAAEYSASRSIPFTSFTPGPASGPSKTGRTSTSAWTVARTSVER